MFINCNKCTTLGQDIDSGGGDACVGTEALWKFSVLCAQFCYEPKTPLKIKSILKIKMRLSSIDSNMMLLEHLSCFVLKGNCNTPVSGYTTATTLEIKPKSSDLRQQGMLNLVFKALEVSVISDSELEEGLIHGLGKASFSATLFSKGLFPSMQGRPHSLGSSVLVLAW